MNKHRSSGGPQVEQTKYTTPTSIVAAQRDTQSQFCIHCGAWLGCLGLEPTPELYIDHLVQIFREVKRVLRDDGTLWLNIGDSYASSGACGGGSPVGNRKYREKDKIAQQKMGSRLVSGLKPKDMVLIPFRLALALQADGWWVRSDIIWHKPNVMPQSVKDRPTTDFEHVFLLAKSMKYYYDQDAIREPQTGNTHGRTGNFNPPKTAMAQKGTKNNPSFQKAISKYIEVPGGRNKRTVWTIPTKPYPEAHFATFPPELVKPMILAGSKEGDVILDPFAGSGTTLAEAKRHGRHYLGIEAQPEYIPLIIQRINKTINPTVKRNVKKTEDNTQLYLDL